MERGGRPQGGQVRAPPGFQKESSNDVNGRKRKPLRVIYRCISRDAISREAMPPDAISRDAISRRNVADPTIMAAAVIVRGRDCKYPQARICSTVTSQAHIPSPTNRRSLFLFISLSLSD